MLRFRTVWHNVAQQQQRNVWVCWTKREMSTLMQPTPPAILPEKTPPPPPTNMQPKYTADVILKSTAGAAVGIGALSAMSFIGGDATVMVAGMGSSAVLLFAAPHLPFSQPHNVIVGHTASAITGSIVNLCCPTGLAVLGPPIACAVALGVMQISRSVHPPAGGTAIAASLGNVGGDFHVAFFPVPCFTSSVILVMVTIMLNPVLGRRYPVQW